MGSRTIGSVIWASRRRPNCTIVPLNATEPFHVGHSLQDIYGDGKNARPTRPASAIIETKTIRVAAGFRYERAHFGYKGEIWSPLPERYTSKLKFVFDVVPDISWALKCPLGAN
jgi:hypothetical protein